MSEYAVVNPATGETEQEFDTITDSDLGAAVDGASQALRAWAHETSVEERAALIRRVGDLHAERREELAAIIEREMGKQSEAALGEVDFCTDIYHYYADHGPDFLADEEIDLRDGSGSAMLRRGPLGVLLGIMPWNYPYYQVARFAGPNLITGNTILLKHAPQCPESASALEQMFRDAGAPEGVYTNIFATNEQIEGVIADPRVQGISLTGSERAGAAVAEIAGRNLKKVVLELGGSDPFILLSTDDMDATVGAAVGARLDNTGQACNAGKRFIVADDLYDDFLSRFTDAMVGSEVGPLSSLAAAERLEEQVGRAVEQGASLTSGGERSGAHYPPAVLTGVTAENDAHHEELFGPVATVYRASDEAHAIELANDTPFGLGSYVFTTDQDQALRVADALDTGMVFVNIVGGEASELPFGGVKRSGSGRELGRFGMEEFVNKKMIRING